ncbi:MAG: hypothetical protein ACI4PF_05170 [Christensenellales bacterium]
MDQTISEVVYRGRINSSVRAWNEQMNGSNNVSGGTIVASDGNTYKKVKGRLVPVVEGNKTLERSVKFLNSKLVKDGLINNAKTSEAVEAKTAEASEFATTM